VGWQLWRVVTSVLFAGQLSFQFLMSLFMLYTYSKQLELEHFTGRTADYMVFVAFSVVCLAVRPPHALARAERRRSMALTLSGRAWRVGVAFGTGHRPLAQRVPAALSADDGRHLRVVAAQQGPPGLILLWHALLRMPCARVARSRCAFRR
jgi:hypothetical protein